MAPGFLFWVLVGWSVLTMAEGQDVVTPPGGSQDNVTPTDCQIFTLTPPPPTRKPAVTRAQPNTRIFPWTWFHFLPRRPGFYWPPNRPLLLPNYNPGFQFHPFYLPQGRLSGRYFLRGQLQGGSSSEESIEK
ncbi:odontogenesis associated phosphoprotein [Cricetulus griseus]|uniref:Odontogenesis associated phosphoprotein n=1 Tax=Cricetulus griseus TaxID=10029 RepID=A0A8C2M3K6_CRIGR|nr:odontogenesis associated phosphoprotein [Cricetulus griseus]XP_027244159.1 odontogenesis associated phosphoprotein [Cricetulus griseus]